MHEEVGSEWLRAVRERSQAHARRYLNSGGSDGYAPNGLPILILMTTGRRSGQRRQTPLLFGRDADRFVIVASLGGSPRHPAWYLNLVADPRVEVQVRAVRHPGLARTAAGDERARLWALMTSLFPAYDAYQARTKREIPVVVVEPN
jgi:deazaflavin-dependent oxidoreductase (nitroreductase family)